MCERVKYALDGPQDHSLTTGITYMPYDPFHEGFKSLQSKYCKIYK